MRIVVGLGNPGRRYAQTRHNAGARVVDIMGAEQGTTVRRARFMSLTADVRIGGGPVMLMKPQTYMNLSGKSVKAALDYYKVPVDSMLVIVDDVNLEVGGLRFRRDGSAGGHKGLKSVEEEIGTDGYPRLRIGVGPPEPGADLTDFVLTAFDPQVKELMKATELQAANAAAFWVTDGIDACMNMYNRRGRCRRGDDGKETEDRGPEE